MIDWKEVDLGNCPITGTLDLVGDRWSMLILREVMSGLTRFDELVDHIGIGRSTLSDRIHKLVGAGILVERAYREPGSRARNEYVLTPKGWDLSNVVFALSEWGDRYVLDPGDHPVELIDAATGSRLRLALVDDDDNVVPLERIRPVPGPGLRLRADVQRPSTAK